MRKILSLLTASMLLLLSSCELNEMPEFDDSNAFVAFENTTMSIDEDGGTINIPVTLASVKGMSAEVSYTLIDGTAEEGINFTPPESGTLTFDAENRTQYIEVSIIDVPGEFTGDLQFQVQLNDDGTIKPSAENLCVVTIKDLDHPLSQFFGDWTANADSYYFGDGISWDVTIEKDENDVAVLWITDIVYGFPNWGFSYPNVDTRFYATVNEEKTELSFAIGQTCAYQYQGEHDISLNGLTSEMNVIESGSVVATVSEDGNTITFEELGLYVTDATGYWDGILPGMTWTKK